MTKIHKTFLLLAFFFSYSYAIDCHFFGEFQSYGGHYYATTVKKMGFEEAKALAKRNGGYLAIPNIHERINSSLHLSLKANMLG